MQLVKEIKYILPSLANKKNLIKYPTYKFSFELNKWIDTSIFFTTENYNKNDNKNIINNKSLSFISYNVWFENVNWKNRIESLFNIFKQYSPDFICLQEVTDIFLRELIKEDFIKKNYFFSGNFEGSYDVLILSKYNTNFFNLKFGKNTKMGRNLLLMELIHSFDNKNFNNILIATSHFESLNNSEFRKKQLEASFEILNFSDSEFASTSKCAFLMGDFNFDSSWKNEEINIDSKFNDCWFVHKEKNKLNNDERFTMPANKSFSAWRPDRILYKNENVNDNFFLNLDYFEIIGKEHIKQDEFENFNNVKTPSDHYGLYALFEIKENKN
jgi:tyrosyl-DNA phosphodiesterase 2